MVTEKRAAGGMWLVEATAAPEVFTPERFSDEQVMIAKTVRTFLAQEIAPLDARLEQKDLPLMREVVKKIADLGVFAADVPVEYGGLGLDRMTGLLLAETISRGSVSSSVGAHLTIGMLPIVFFGTDAQRRRYLPRMAAGEWIGAYALTEPTAGSDALSLRTTAVPDADGGYRLSGTKQFITNGGIADVFVLYAKVEGKVTCFIVERDTPGFTVGPEEHKMGLRGSSTTSLFLDNARVPRENVLGEIGRGHVVALNILNVGRLKLGGGCVGSAKHALRDAVAYARERRQFGRPIASFGLIKQKIAEMAIRLYLAESAVYRAGGLLDEALAGIDVAADEGGHRIARALEEYAPECGINKVLGSETLDFVVDEMVQIYGGYGFIEDYPAARAYRDARINRLYEGTNEINRLVIAGQLLRRAGAGRIPLLDAAQRAATELSNATDGGRGPSRTTRIGEEGDFGILEDVLARAKTVTLACLGRAVERLGPRLDDHQEVLGWLSDQIIDVFAVESGALRAQQGAGSHRGGLMVGIARDAAGELGPRIERLAIRVLTAVEDGALLDRDLAGLRVMLQARPQNTMAARRAIADQVLDAGGYALGLPSG